MAEIIAPRTTTHDIGPDEVVLISEDKEEFVVKRECIEQYSVMLSNLLEDLPRAPEVPLQNVNGTVLAKVLEYINRHGAMETKDGEEKPSPKYTEEELKAWDLEFVKVDQAMLFEIILAANYLDSKKLLELTCRTVADMMKGKTVEEIRKTFNIKNDLSAEEEEEIRRENQWVFE